MMSLCGNTDKMHPFFFERNFLDTVSVLFSLLFVTEEKMIHGKAKNLFYPFKGDLNTSTSVTGKESPKQLIFAQQSFGCVSPETLKIGFFEVLSDLAI